MKKTRKKLHRMISLLCILVMVAGLVNPMAFKATALEVYAAPAGAIEIDTPEELMKIGKDANYPLSGDYVLTKDLDMTGIDYTPIGGMEGSKGTTSGANVFNGTFDGQGHLIANLTMNIDYRATGENYIQMGLFSVIASNNPNDYAVVENIVFANVNMTADVEGGLTAAGTLAGEVNGYATVQNIAVLDGTIYINGFNQSDTVGAGGVIGECRTEGAPFNNNVTIKNIYNGAEVLAGSSTFTYYAGGIVGRVRGSNVKELSGCVNTGRISYRGEQGFAITAIASGADDSCVNDCYFLFATGDPCGDGTRELEEATLKSGVLPTGLDSKVWYASQGSFPLLQICKNEGPSGYLGLMSLNPEFAEGENASCVTKDFTLPGTVGNVKVTWTSSNTNAISIEGNTAKVKGVMAETRVILTAKTADGKTRNYTIIILSNVDAQFDQLYANAGVPLTVTIKNAPADLKCTYTWSVGGQNKPAVTGNSYTPTYEDNEKFIKVVVKATNYDATWETSMYMSDLPVVYIDTEDGQDVINKDVYKFANIKIQGNDQFPSESVLYDGLTEIKGRGNSTWDYSASNGLKKPYRLKFDGKADVLGMGKSKHWVLLANVIDHTNMRNELIYEFSEDIGMECVLDFEPCVVILNGEYRGFYQIGEHKRVDEGRIDVFSWESLGEDIAGAIAKAENMSDAETSDLEEYIGELDFSWLDTGKVTYKGKTYTVSDYYKGTIPEFTGGFAFDMDFRLGQSKFISKFYTDYGYPMFFEAPEYAKTSPIMMEFAQTYLQAFENAIHDDDYYAMYDGEEVHYSELFDVESLMQSWYVVEYSMNWDSMKNSTLMYKDLDTAEGRSLMKMGPVWDFDWAWGNMNMYSNATVWQIQGWHTTMDSFCEVAYQRENWNRYLISDPYFAMLVYEKWAEVRAVIEDMIKDGGKIDQLEEYYRAASVANDEKWASTYNRYGGYGLTNGQVVRKQSERYDDAVETMEYFVKNRVAWFDTQFTSIDNLLKSWNRYQGSNALAVSDIGFPEDGKTEITATVSNNNIKKIAFYVNGIRSGEVDVTDEMATLTVDDSALRACAEDEELLNCVQIRAMDADGNFLKNGSAVMTNYRVFEKYVEDNGQVDQIEDSVVINEIESSDADGGNDWVEIYNKGDKAVDISGWFVTDDKGLDRLTSGATTPLPKGTVLEPGAFLVLEENVNFTCGLGSGDTVTLYDAKSNVVDTATWGDHAAGTVSRVPDGTGEFVDQAPTKGVTNGGATPDPTPTPIPDPGPVIEVDSPIAINEIESSDINGGHDWVEIINTGDKAVDISGWFVTDDKGLERLEGGEATPLPEGTVLQPGELYVLEETIDFTCGLGAADTVFLYNADSKLVDFYSWEAHAAEGLSRVPDGTGIFVDIAPTKGASNTAKADVGLIASFDFNEAPAEGEAFDGGNAQAAGTYTLVERDGGQAIKFDKTAQQFLTVTAKDGSSLLTGLDELTVSFMFNPISGSTNWAFFAAPNADAPSYPNEHYLGILGGNENISVERYDNNGSRPSNPSYAAGVGEWYHVTVVFTAGADAKTILYINGEKVSEVNSAVDISNLLGEESVLYIGKATWSGGEYADALVDNYKIYNRALDANEVVSEMNKGETPVTADKTALQEVIDAVKELVKKDYEKDSWAALQDALASAEAVLAEENTSQAIVDAVEKALIEAKDNLLPAPELPYEDVTEADWFYDAVYYNFVEKTMTGLDEKHFGPYGQLSRAQFALILYRIEGEPKVSTDKSFGDISGDEWYGPAVLWAAEAGIVNGYENGSFGPVDNITREQMALMMFRYANYLEKDTSKKEDYASFKDASSVSGFAGEAMQWVTAMGIITGKENGTLLDPQGNTARAEAAAIIERFMTAYAE